MSVSRLKTWWAGTALAPARGTRAPGDDWALWHRARAGHAASAAELVSRLGQQALGLALQFTGSREDAEDAVQDAFLRLWRSDPRDDQGCRLSTYFNTIVINRCRSRITARTDVPTDDDTLSAMLDATEFAGHDNARSDACGLTASDTARRLREAIAALPVRQRMAIAMWTYADASADDIARAMELDANAAHQLLHRAKRSLRAILEGASP